MLISELFVKFIMYSMMGWIWESIYCTVKEKEWQDRGFLFGPVCPIYGVGAVLTSLIFTYVPVLNSGNLTWWQLFLICAVGSAILEYSTSYVLEVIFHAKWWDYSEIPLNINGRICLPATCAFGVAGVLIVRYVFPPIDRFYDLGAPMFMEFLSLLLMAIFAADMALTVASLTQLLQQISAYEADFNEIMAAQYQKIEDQQEKIKTKVVEYAGRMTYTQRQSLKKIKHFSLPSRETAASAFKNTFKNVKLPHIANSVKSLGTKVLPESKNEERHD